MSAARAVKSQAADQRNKIIAGVAFGLVAAGLLYFELSDSGPTNPAAIAPPVVTTAPSASPARSATATASPSGNIAGAAAHSVGTTSAALDPTLHMQAMLVTESVVYNGSGRNIFAGGKDAFYTAPVIPKVIAPVRTSGGPTAPVYTPPPQPAGPPPINLKFFGTATTADGHRKAFLLHGDDVFLASDGDIVQRKYRVISVGASSVQVEDLTNNNRQTLPLLANP